MTQDDPSTATWPPRRRAALLVLGVVVAIAAAAIGGALVAQVLTDDYHVGENATYVAPDGLEVELGEDITTNRQNPFPDSSTVDLGPSIGFSADGTAEVRFAGTADDWLVLSQLDASTNELRVRPENQTDVNVEGAASRVEVRSVTLDDGVADLRVRTSGTTTLRVWDLPADDTVLAIDADSGEHIETIQTDGSGSGSFTVSEDRDVEFVADISTPELTNPDPSDGALISAYETNLSVDVADGDFPESWGDEVTVTFWDVNGSTAIGTQTITSNGTVSTTWSNLEVGSNYWNVTAADEYGNAGELGAMEVVTPEDLTIRDEETPSELVDNANVELEFYFDGGTQIVGRNTTTGRINMTGLPVDESFIVVADAPGYTPRRIYVESLFEQQRVYLLNQSTAHHDVTFELEDFTGNFPTDDTVLVVERGINGSWQTVQGDFFGATGEWTAQLRRNTRHRLRLVNVETGETRDAGTFTPVGDTVQTVRVLPTGVTVGGPGVQVNVEPSVRTLPAADGTSVTVEVLEDGAEIDQYQITMVYRNDSGTTTLYDQTFSGPDGTTVSPSFNLSGLDGGTLNVTVSGTTTEGAKFDTQASFRIAEHFDNDYGLLSTLEGAPGVLGIGNAGTTLIAAVLTIIGTTAVASFTPVSTDAVGAVAVLFVTVFAIVGFVEWTFVAGVGITYAAMWTIWRGI